MTPPPTLAETQELVLATRWRITTERLVETRSRFRELNDAESMDIAVLRRLARRMHDLELERNALARALEAAEG